MERILFDPMLFNNEPDAPVSRAMLDAMRWAVYTRLIQGVSDELLSPKAGATRAQAATLLMRFSATMRD